MKRTRKGGPDWGGWEDFHYYGTEEDYYRGERGILWGGRDFDCYGERMLSVDAVSRERESGGEDNRTKTKPKTKMERWGKAKVDSTERDLAAALKVLDLEDGIAGVDTAESNPNSSKKPGTEKGAKPRLFELGCPYPPDALYVPFASGGPTSRRRGKGSYFVRGGLEDLGRGRIVGSKETNK